MVNQLQPLRPITWSYFLIKLESINSTFEEATIRCSRIPEFLRRSSRSRTVGSSGCVVNGRVRRPQTTPWSLRRNCSRTLQCCGPLSYCTVSLVELPYILHQTAVPQWGSASRVVVRTSEVPCPSLLPFHLWPCVPSLLSSAFPVPPDDFPFMWNVVPLSLPACSSGSFLYCPWRLPNRGSWYGATGNSGRCVLRVSRSSFHSSCVFQSTRSLSASVAHFLTASCKLVISWRSESS